ncbi:hypothetical protein P7K49_025600, partial [Saguinus oedipus]
QLIPSLNVILGGKATFKASARRAEVQLLQYVLQSPPQPAQGHHLHGVERSFQDTPQVCQGLQTTGPGQVAALRGSQQVKKGPEVLQVVGYLDHVSRRQTEDNLLVDRQYLIHLGKAQVSVEPGNEFQTSDPLFGGDRLLCRRKRENKCSAPERNHSQSPLPSRGPGGSFSGLPPSTLPHRFGSGPCILSPGDCQVSKLVS